MARGAESSGFSISFVQETCRYATTTKTTTKIPRCPLISLVSLRLCCCMVQPPAAKAPAAKKRRVSEPLPTAAATTTRKSAAAAAALLKRQDLLTRLTSMKEQEGGHVETVVSSGIDEEAHPLDDPAEKSLSTFREKALDEFRYYNNVVKKRRYVPRTYVGETLKLGSIEMGKCGTRGDDIEASHPFKNCNLADFMDDDGRFNLVSFLELQKECFPTLFKLAVCLASIRMNEVGCERFFSTAGLYHARDERD